MTLHDLETTEPKNNETPPADGGHCREGGVEEGIVEAAAAGRGDECDSDNDDQFSDFVGLVKFLDVLGEDSSSPAAPAAPVEVDDDELEMLMKDGGQGKKAEQGGGGGEDEDEDEEDSHGWDSFLERCSTDEREANEDEYKGDAEYEEFLEFLQLVDYSSPTGGNTRGDGSAEEEDESWAEVLKGMTQGKVVETIEVTSSAQEHPSWWLGVRAWFGHGSGGMRRK